MKRQGKIDRKNLGIPFLTGNTLREFDLSFRRYRSLWFLAWKKKRKKRKKLFCLVTFLLCILSWESESVSRGVSRLRISRLANIYESLLESGFEELIYGLVWGNNMIFLLVLFHAFFTRDIFMADWEGFFSFGDYFFFLLFFPFYDTWTVNVIKRNRKIKAFHLVEKRKGNLFEIIHSYNLFYVWY